jgi:hypothetical protein
MAYSKQENAIIERANKEFNRHIRAIIFERREVKDIWSDMVPLVQRIMNSEIVESIGVSPAQLLFGNSVRLDKGIFLPHIRNIDSSVIVEDEQIPRRLSQWISRMLDVQSKLIASACKNQIEKDAQWMKSKEKDFITEFPIGSYVLITYNEGAMGRKPPTKFHTYWKGPFRVVNNIGSIYTVQNLVTNQNEDYHVKQLKLFIYDNDLVNPEEVAYKDNQFFEIEEILNHKGNFSKLKKVQFFTKFSGFDDSLNSWLPWNKETRRNIKVHEYLIRKNFQYIIPIEYRHLYPNVHFEKIRKKRRKRIT